MANIDKENVDLSLGEIPYKPNISLNKMEPIRRSLGADRGSVLTENLPCLRQGKGGNYLYTY
jgi:hypothetical protein